MRRILLILEKDLSNRLKSPWAVLILLLIPFMMTGIMGAVFAPSSDSVGLPKVKVLLVDKDKNLASKFLIQALDNPQMKDFLQISLVDEEQGKKLMSQGKASALIVIPEKFSQNLLDNKVSQFVIVKNPSERFLPRIVEEMLNTFAVLVSGVVQVFAQEIKLVRTLWDVPLDQVSIIDMVPFLEQEKEKITSLGTFLNPLLIQMKEEAGEKEKKKSTTIQDIFGVVLPAMSIMFLLFIIETFLRDILTDREDGTLQRMMFAPMRAGEYIVAKIISGWLMGLLVYLVVIGFGKILFDISWGNYFYLFIFITVTCFWISAFFALLNSFFKNRNQAGAVTTPIVLIFSALGGSIIPASQLPGGFNLASGFTLNYWFIKGTGMIAQGDFPILPFIIILSTAVVLFVSAVAALGRRIRI